MTQPRKVMLIGGPPRLGSGGQYLKRRISESAVAMNSTYQRKRRITEDMQSLLAIRRKTVSVLQQLLLGQL